MPFINARHKTQRQSKHVFFDGSTDSHRGVTARIRSIFSFGSRQSEDSSSIRHDSLKAHRHLQSSVETTVISSPKVRIATIPDDLERDFLGDLPQMIQHSVSSTSTNSPVRCTFITNRRALRRSHSYPGLMRRISHKLCQDAGDSTMVHRTEMRSRPSLQKFNYCPKCSLTAEDSFQLVSASPLACKSRSYSSATKKQLSIAATSDGQTTSPRLVESPGTSVAPMETFLHIPSSADPAERKLLTVPETTFPNASSIVTVEATATAKIFFETHFNSILSGVRPRSIRRRELERKLQDLGLPPEVQRRARKAWLKQETEHLRTERVLMTRTNCPRAAKGVSIAGYEVVKVLGKGSFGVVRLVKEKRAFSVDQEDASSTTILTPGSSRQPSRTDLATAVLKSTVKDALAPLVKHQRRYFKAKEVYAMKVIRKSEMVRNSQEGHLRAERDFLVAAAGSRWIIPLVAAFQDSHNLYLVMDYCIGGDFLGLLIRKSTLSEEVTRWYIAEMVLCIEEAHRMRWIHRDVKPDNFLIDADGHLKISDFGLAFDGEWSHNQGYFNHQRQSLVEKLGIDLVGDDQDLEEAKQLAISAGAGNIVDQANVGRPEKRLPGSAVEPPEGDSILDWHNREHKRKLARSVVGTSQYMAPEVIRGDMYDGRCDWWSVGIILYECLYGHTPFACETRQETKFNILKHKTTLSFPQSVSKHELPVSFEALDLMMQLLQEKEMRLCSRKYINNDFARRMIARLHVRQLPTDKAHEDFNGHFVYPDDANDLKRHAFFDGIDWDNMHVNKPPFVPRVKNYADTKYFDEEEPVSDMSMSSDSDEDNKHSPESHNAKDSPEHVDANENALPKLANFHGEPHLSGHQQEDQKIIPSNPVILNGGIEDETQNQYELAQPTPNPLMTPSQIDGHDGRDSIPLPLPAPFGLPTKPAGHLQTQVIDVESIIKTPYKKRRKEKKRPRDKILRDATTSKIAMRLRKQGAFIGYEYSKARGVNDCLPKVENSEVVPDKRRQSMQSSEVREVTTKNR